MNRLSTAALTALVALAAWVAPGSAAEKGWEITVTAGKHGRHNVPVRAVLAVPEAVARGGTVSLVDAKGKPVACQLAAPALLDEAATSADGKVARVLHFVVDSLKSGESATYTATASSAAAPAVSGFAWHDTPGKSTELRYGDRPVLRYMYEALDDSTPERRFVTYKVFHHLFDPAGGRIVTNGPDGEHPYVQKEILYPHHRGLFFGFRQCSYEGVPKADLWHCQNDDFQQHAGFLAAEAGPVLGRHRVAVEWHGKGKKVFVKEEREMTVYHVPGGQLVEFASELRSTVGKVKLDGDPQHAGFQFRAHNEVAAKTKGQTYYIRPDGIGKPGETRNWPQDKSQVNLPWKAMSFVLGDQRYTAAYIDKPTNPKEARFSERDYGRFGSYIVYELDTKKPLRVNYRLWLQEGEMTMPQVQELSDALVDPPQVAVKNL